MDYAYLEMIKKKRFDQKIEKMRKEKQNQLKTRHTIKICLIVLGIFFFYAAAGFVGNMDLEAATRNIVIEENDF